MLLSKKRWDSFFSSPWFYIEKKQPKRVCSAVPVFWILAAIKLFIKIKFYCFFPPLFPLEQTQNLYHKIFCIAFFKINKIQKLFLVICLSPSELNVDNKVEIAEEILSLSTSLSATDLDTSSSVIFLWRMSLTASSMVSLSTLSSLSPKGPAGAFLKL